MSEFQVRTIDLGDEPIIRLVADRMRLTLMEVVGPEVGAAMYELDWLVDRVKQHLDPTKLDGAVFVAESKSGEVLGHTIVRMEHEEDGVPFGLFSTFYVDPSARGRGIGKVFVEMGEKWMLNRNLKRSATYTAEDNEPLHRLMVRQGYSIVLRKDTMVAFSRELL